MVTVLFVDIVGFTARSDRADPEEVRRPLLPFHTRVKEDIEWFGGTLDKFIGDAAMGVFGAPVTHEDDPERAVRTALRILETVQKLNEADPSLGLAVRIGIETGEAVVALGGSGPLVGERVAGDVVNTASRIQGVAPAGGIVVGEGTYRLIRDVVDAEHMEPTSVKGKAEPLRVFRVHGIRRREEFDAAGPHAPFVGRDRELELLEQTFARVVGEPTVRLVTIVGEPGIGKSRLLSEFLDRLEMLPSPPLCRVGRCSPYGESAAVAAFSEIVRAQAGISDADAPDEAAAKLSATLATLEPRPSEQEWLRARLAPLVGLRGGIAGAVDREESFAAWQRFVWAVGSQRPLVLVFEGLQWADPAALAFVRHLAERLARVPVLLVCTARPEFLEEHSDWPTASAGAATISLSRLSDTDMTMLLTALLGGSMLPVETMAALVDAAGGNPFYAHEFVRMLAAEEAATSSTGEATGGRIRVPASVQALVAAHLDALPPEERLLLQDAAVVGDVVWPGALAAMSGSDERTVREGLRGLADKGLVRASPDGSTLGEASYVFAYTLLREVAYRQIPRGARASKHRAAAEWAERKAGERAGEFAEFLAHHYALAWRLLRAAGAADQATELDERARRYLEMAGDRALAVDEARADSHYRSALDLLPPGHPDRPAVLVKVARTGHRVGRLSSREALTAYEEAVKGFRTHGNDLGAGEAMVRAALQLGMLGDRARTRELIQDAIELLETQPPGRELALGYAARAEEEMLAGRSAECLEWAQRALALTRSPGLEEVAVMAHHLRGNARCELGDPMGLDDLREAIRVSSEAGLGLETVRSYSYLGEWLWLTEGPGAGLELYEQAIELAERRGFPLQAMWARVGSLWLLFDLGRWDELVRRTGEVMAASSELGDNAIAPVAPTYLARVLSARGRADSAAALLARALPEARQLEDLQVLGPALVTAALVEETRGNLGAATVLVRELEEVTRDRSPVYRESHLPDAVRVCLAAGELELADRLLADARSHVTRCRHCVTTVRALVHEAKGEMGPALEGFAAAVRDWTSFGSALERAFALMGAGRCLLAVGREGEATARFEEARAAFAALGAEPMAEEAERALPQIAPSARPSK